MRKIILSTLIALAAFSGARAQDEMFKEFGDNKDITVVYISKALLGLAGGMVFDGSADIKSLANKLSMLEIYSSEQPEAVKQMRKVAEKLLKDNSELEILMKTKNGDQLVTFVAKKGKDGKIKELLMIADEQDEFSIIRLLGSFTMKDVEKITSGN
ncbi:MAG: DUF4252 domain-containing protein [Prevotellaceae bacterium]|nr:DUF4252 domain-containing protein [Prevotellaceae bacterium]